MYWNFLLGKTVIWEDMLCGKLFPKEGVVQEIIFNRAARAVVKLTNGKIAKPACARLEIKEG